MKTCEEADGPVALTPTEIVRLYWKTGGLPSFLRSGRSSKEQIVADFREWYVEFQITHEGNEHSLTQDREVYPHESDVVHELLTEYRVREGRLFDPGVVHRSRRIQQFPLIHLRPSPHCPRHIEDGKELEGLTESLRNRGVLVPILVRPLTTAYDPSWGGAYEIICGHRRVAAAKKAGLRTIPGIQCLLSDEEAFELQVIENIQRENLHPLDEAEAVRTVYEKVRSELGNSSDQAQKALELTASRIGKPLDFVAQRLELNDLTAETKEQLRNGVIQLDLFKKNREVPKS